MKVPFTWKPTGWFMVGWSAEFPVGEVRPLHYFGEDLVAWRTDDGALQIMDAHCPHLGAHIGHHGKVHGDCVQCPYHGWTYGTDGVNRSIPYEDRPNLTKRLRVWPVVEQYDCVFLWHQPARRARPRWEMPDIFTSFPSLDVDPAHYYRPYPELSIKYAGEPVHPQIPLENGPDSVHFQYVHSRVGHPGACSTGRWSTRRSTSAPVGPTRAATSPTRWRWGSRATSSGSVARSARSKASAQYRLVFATTPVDDEHSDMFYSIWWPRLPGDDSPAPPPELRERIEKEFIVTLWDDLEIWRYQRYVEHPALAQAGRQALRAAAQVGAPVLRDRARRSGGEGAGMRFEDRVALVTGGGSGIGLAAVERFVHEGARVVVGDVDKARLVAVEETFGEAVRVVECDVTDEAAVEVLAATATDAFGRLDIAFANAGIGTSGLIVDSDVDDWKRTVDVCLVGPMLTIKHSAPRMGAGGAIVVTASLNAVQPGRGMSAYCAAKAGAAMLVQVAAMELGPLGIRVNAIAPGLVRTGLTNGMWRMPEIVAEYVENAPIGRSATPNEIANLVAFLASDEAGFMTGGLHLVDGGAATKRYPDVLGRVKGANATS